MQFTGKLKTPVISKRSSSTSKSPRSRSLTPSHRQQPSQSPVLGPSRPSSREEDFPADLHDASSPPSVPNPPPLALRQSFETSPRSDTFSRPSHLDLLLTPSMSHSSPSSAQDSASPPTPPPEPYSRPPLVPDSLLSTENGQSTLFSAIHSLLLPSQQKLVNPEAPRPYKPGPAPPGDPLGIARTTSTSQSSGTHLSGPLHGTHPSLSSASSGSRVGADDVGSVYSSRSTATSDAGAGIGLSMLQDFPDNADEREDDEDEDEDGEDSGHESSSQSERGRTSLEETVDGFPAPPTQIPTPSSQATSFILDPRRPISSSSDDSEEGDGASLYDNYRYSRLSISSKMSKSSGYTVATIPPPIPTELPLPVRSHSQGSQYSVPTQFSEPLSSSSEPSSSASPPPRQVTPPTTATQATTRTIPPPLTLGSSEKRLEPSNSNVVTATTVTSPLLHHNFGAPQSGPSRPNSPTKRSPVDAAPVLRQKVEQVKDSNEKDVPAGTRRTSPQSPTALAVATALGSPTASTTSEKKRRDGLPAFVVMNPTPPPPPYTPKAPSLLETTSAPATPTHTTMLTSAVPHIPSPAGAITGAMADQTTTNAPQPPTTTNSSSVFLPHPNAPKPNSSPQAPLYGRAMPPAPLLPPALLIQVMRRAAQMRIGPNGLPSFCTIYATTARDLSTSVGPVLIYFSLDPPNDIPANRMRMVPVPAPAPAAVTVPPQPLPQPAPIPPSNQNSLSSMPAPGSQQPFPGQPGKRQGEVATTDVIPRPGFVPKAGAVRPRSRSFSGFDSAVAPETQSKEQKYCHFLQMYYFFADAGTVHSRDSKTSSRPSTAPDSGPRVNRLAARAAAHTARIHQPRQYTPSPLSLSRSSNGPDSSSLAISVPKSPSTPSHPVSSPTSPTLRRRLTPVKSEPSLRASARKSAPNQERNAPVPAPVPVLASTPQSSVSKPDGAVSSRAPASLPSAARMNSPPSIRISASESQALSSHTAPGNESAFLRSRPRRQSSDSPRQNGSSAMDVDGSSSRSRSSDLRSPVPLPPSTSTPIAPALGRSGSLRSKISLSALRAKSARDDDGLHEADTVQVKDTDFELVRPNVRLRVSEDSAINGKSSGSEGQPSFLRVDSPAMSTTSGGGTSDSRSPVSPSGMSLPPVTASAASSAGAGVEAHRARELKWISVMSTIPPSQARKGKKIRKLLQDGVPASVRYQVWAHLTDSKAKRIEGLYAQFGEREKKVPAFAEIQRDARDCFVGDSRLSQPNGPLVSLLQAYLTMVPDIQYSKGLTFIAGQLLLQSPEEDAFWIFVSLMDSHLRPYFSSNAAQLDIDASLFAKAVETVDPSIAKKLFVDMAIAPIRVCRPWSVSFFSPQSFNLQFVWS